MKGKTSDTAMLLKDINESKIQVGNGEYVFTSPKGGKYIFKAGVGLFECRTIKDGWRVMQVKETYMRHSRYRAYKIDGHIIHAHALMLALKDDVEFKRYIDTDLGINHMAIAGSRRNFGNPSREYDLDMGAIELCDRSENMQHFLLVSLYGLYDLPVSHEDRDVIRKELIPVVMELDYTDNSPSEVVRYNRSKFREIGSYFRKAALA